MTGISASGIIVGYAGAVGGYFNFSYSQGIFKKLTLAGVPNATVYGISPMGNTLVGTYEPSSGVGAGFSYHHGQVQELQFSGAIATYLGGVNDSGQVSGTFYDASDVAHCFLWTPPAPTRNESQQ